LYNNDLSTCITTAKGEKLRTEGYLWNEDRYQIYINIDKFRNKFKHLSAEQLFKQFDNLKILSMLESITVPLILENKRASDISELSDGQLQSVYIYAISELFKDSNCLTLMDEPDSFLHPEWQFDFLKQIDEISDDAKKTNHILLSSHSAVTLLSHKSKNVRYFELKKGLPSSCELPKHIAIQKLSSELISA
jgi:translation initiation factor RLI1